MTNRLTLLWVMAVASIGLAQSPVMFNPTGSMTTPRAGHTATLLTNGKVLLAGGVSSGFPAQVLGSAEIYDPATGSVTTTGNMIMARYGHTATLLADGRVLIVGGFAAAPYGTTASAELYDPSTETFTAAGDAAAGHTATLLASGKVLIAGSGANAVLYDPATGTFAEAGPYADPPWSVGTATLLPNGKVLITGCAVALCDVGMAQIYDPVANSFTPTGGPRPGCFDNICWFADVNTATLLTNGKVLIASGKPEHDRPDDAELYDPAAGKFTSLGYTIAPHEFSAATLLPDGTVLITGGQLPGGYGHPGAEFYIVTTGTFALAGTMSSGRHSHTATLLPDGTVLLAGGYGVWEPTASGEIYRPSVLIPAPALFSVSGAGRGQGAILHANTPRLVSPSDPAVVGEYLEIYLTGLTENSVIPPQVSIGGRMAEVLWFGNTPGFLRLNQINIRVPSGVAPGPAVPVRLAYMSRPSNEVTIGVR
jgi:large repetitive protein